MNTALLVNLVLAVLLVEALLCWAWQRSSAQGLPVLDVAGSLLAGTCLVLAVRDAAAGASGERLAVWLAAAGAAHAFDLYRRWRQRVAPDADVRMPRHP
ncbi:hypothetical protein MW290_02635 [Aquincola tertiaricarbonis]|uniref:Uncharacterized protein n=1 Tax=Aquincola tertiaricarbonis TaxID=391953 RepID=A0ABY4S253_AQUTE|nr:hypothetical protein [Aquincola tertiaricarbonis]URI07538.1 hypothetical protein MW290_02635 [Aquincola tertiaricarbonis]